jgi:hypothetical protein
VKHLKPFNESTLIADIEPEFDQVLNIARDEGFDVEIIPNRLILIRELGWSLEYQFVRIEGHGIKVIEEIIRRFHHINGSVEFNLSGFTVVGQPNVLRETNHTHFDDIDEAIDNMIPSTWVDATSQTCFFYLGVEGSYKNFGKKHKDYWSGNQ